MEEYRSTVDKDLVERREVIGAKTKAKTWKAGPYKGRLQIIKNLSIFDPKLFFFIKASLWEAR